MKEIDKRDGLPMPGPVGGASSRGDHTLGEWPGPGGIRRPSFLERKTPRGAGRQLGS